MSDHITISDSSQWPPQVFQISQYLTNDLPPSLLSAQPTLSPRASHLWTEVTKQHPPSTSHEGLPHELVDIMDTLLSTISIIRTLRDSNATSRETRPFVSLLLYALLRSCYPDAHVSENVRFARTYLDKLGDMTVGEARMIASVVTPLSGESANDAMSSSSDSASTASSSLESIDEFLYARPPRLRSTDGELSTDAELSTDGALSTDGSTPSRSSVESMPPDAHAYDFWRDRRSVPFPFICIADGDSVVEVLRSTAFQRDTWALKDPVIGIGLSEKGFLARVYFAWVDENPLGKDTVHTVTSDAQVSLGAFDLSAPDSALSLGSFLLSLRPQYDVFAQQCGSALCSDAQWRADSYLDELKRLPQSWEDTISTWLHHVQSSMTTSNTESRGRNGRSPASSRSQSPALTSVPAADISQFDVDESIVPHENM
ncbi:hypothetical protein CPB85DRAFT_606822 [Mucidula mucida]|nr:hypothetical protein CPB85DRAFT_606822 [Mucidula mucida]